MHNMGVKIRAGSSWPESFVKLQFLRSKTCSSRSEIPSVGTYHADVESSADIGWPRHRKRKPPSGFTSWMEWPDRLHKAAEFRRQATEESAGRLRGESRQCK